MKMYMHIHVGLCQSASKSDSLFVIFNIFSLDFGFFYIGGMILYSEKLLLGVRKKDLKKSPLSRVVYFCLPPKEVRVKWWWQAELGEEVP